MKGAARNIVFGNGDDHDGDIDDGGAEVRTTPVTLINHTHTTQRTPHIQTLSSLL